MTTAAELTRSALRLIKVASEMSPPSADQERGGLQALKDMISAWEVEGINIGVYPPTRLDEDLQEPEWAASAIKYVLAEQLAATYERELSSNVLKLIVSAHEQLQMGSSVEHPSQHQSNMPLGQGNRHGPRSRVYASAKYPTS